jgi:MFS family permease
MSVQSHEATDPPATAQRTRKGWTLVLASLGVFLTPLDVVVVATALPTLRTDPHASLSDLEWTINAYNLVFACAMLTGAAPGDRFGRRRGTCSGCWCSSPAPRPPPCRPAPVS